MSQSRIRLYWESKNPGSEYRSGVCLHSHTSFSKEWLGTLPYFFNQIPVLSTWINQKLKQYQKDSGNHFDFSGVHWTPPISPPSAYDLEAGQVEFELDLTPLVSITDHDSIAAPISLRRWKNSVEVPISFEWTVPYGTTCFHLGIHNFDQERADSSFSFFNEFTENPKWDRLHELLDLLNQDPETLIVLNHPFWNQGTISDSEHTDGLKRFWTEFGHWFHAVELNGTRTWKENKKVVRLAMDMGAPLISGGDRHGLEPAAILNLSLSNSFTGFVREIREDRLSEIVIMPQYRKPIVLRHLAVMFEALRFYPHFPAGQQYWFDRLYYQSGPTRKPLRVYLEGSENKYLMPVRWVTQFIRFFDRSLVMNLINRLVVESDRLHSDAQILEARNLPSPVGGIFQESTSDHVAA